MRPPILLLALLGCPAVALAQPLPPVPIPPGNPITTAKTNLGKVLFWEEQMSATGTMACGTCHIPSKGGSDPTSLVSNPFSTHPGLDGVLGTPDDITGSQGVVRNDELGSYLNTGTFGLERQVTNRKAPSMIMAAFAPTLFWDGRAQGPFEDPVTGNVVLNGPVSLENQAVGPPVSDVEMGHVGIDWADVTAKLATVKPLGLATNIPLALTTWINGRTYPQLFQEAFGTPDVTATRIAMAIATYERTLIPNQSPFDAFLAGNPGALTPQQQQGRQLFQTPGNCVPCHGGPLTTDNVFHNNGVRPINEDLGRGAITGNPADNGRFRTPSLRNVALRGPYFHNGRFQTLADVVDFYNRGGDFHINQDPIIHPLGLNATQRAAIVAFLESMTDPRVANELPPFDRPTLYSQSTRVPNPYGIGAAGAGGSIPRFVALEPAYLGNPQFTLSLADGLGGAPTFLGIDIARSAPGTTVSGIPFQLAASFAFTLLPLGNLQGAGAGEGWMSLTSALPNMPTLIGQTIDMQAFFLDPDGKNGLSATRGLELTFFAGL